MSKNIVEIKNLRVSFGNVIALKDINFSIQSGEYLAILGPNGSGKSTLLNVLLGINKKDCGEIKIDCPREEVSYVPQISSLNRDFPITVYEAVSTALNPVGFHPFFRLSKEDKSCITKLLSELEISKLANRMISELSGGEFQRLLLARALIFNPKILLLDEPTSAVDARSRKIIYEVLDKRNTQGMTIILVTHDLSAVSQSVSSLACLNTTLVYHGEPKLSKHILNKMYGCPIDLVAHGSPHIVLADHKED